MIKTARLTGCLLFTAAIVLGQATDLPAKLDKVVEGYAKNRNFIGSVLVAKGGKVILEKGYGMANIELDVPNKPETKFRLGSITKQFTSAAILQLKEQGKLSLEDPACKYFENCPEAWKPITIHHLLTHTSGIPSYTAQKEFATPKFMRQPLTPVEVVMITKDKPLEFQPGEKYTYNNTGYVMLGVIIEKASGEKYADYLKKHIFEPLDMQDSGYDVTRTVMKNRAAGYAQGPGGITNADYLDMSLPHAAGSLYSTVRDLYRWDRALYTDKVVSKASRDLMWTPVKNNYGFGWAVNKVHDRKQVGHGGGINGFSTMIQRFPDDDGVVIVLANTQGTNAGALANALSGTLFGEAITPAWERASITVDSKVLDQYAGTYEVGPMTIVATNENGRLMMQPRNQPKSEAFAASETVFFLKNVDVEFTFTEGGLILKQGGATLTGKKVK
jgi:CubicO group peptidase (beta-lactamase class C family)